MDEGKYGNIIQTMLKPTPDYHTASSAPATIEINLNRLSQLFNSFDPAPFHERDLDRDAEEYIIGSAEEIARHRSLVLVIHLPQDQVPAADAPRLDNALHNYFSYRENQERRRLRLLFHDGRVALAIGIAFLFFCVFIRKLALSFGHGTASEIIAEGMLITGWVAMWRPLQIHLYDWLPIYRLYRILRKLSHAPVIVKVK